MARRKTFSHLDVDDRTTIQAYLNQGLSLRKIAKLMGRDKSTISRETERNLTRPESYLYPKCSYLYNHKFCNACSRRPHCVYHRIEYRVVNAQLLFLKRSRKARSVPKISEEKIGLIDSLASPLIKNGQSIHSAYISQNELKSLCSESTLRRLCYGRYLAVKPIDLRRYVRYKREYKKTVDETQYRDVKILANRTYKDYLGYIMKHKTENIVQYDSVIGKIYDEKALLTITFPKYNFQFARIIRKGSADSVNTQIRKVFKKLDNRLIKSIFPINLCDNGSEFSRFNQIEFDEKGEQIIKTFFTTPIVLPTSKNAREIMN